MTTGSKGDTIRVLPMLRRFPSAVSRTLAWSACVAALHALALASAPNALAQTSTATTAQVERPEYESVLGQALDAHARGDFEAARIFMERAHALEPSARTLRGLGIVAFAQRRHLAAIRYLDAALASEVKALPPDLRRSVEELLGHAWSQVGRYEVRLDPPTGDFLVDGVAPDLYAPWTVVLKPGAHQITARAAGRASYELVLEVKPGERETLHFVLAIPPPPEVIEKLVPVARDEQGGRNPHGRNLSPTWYTSTARYIGLGTGAALTLAGVGLWVAGHARLDRVARACRNSDDGACTGSEARKRYNDEHVKVFAISSAVTAGAGLAVLTAVGAIEVYRHRNKERSVHARLGLQTVGVSGTF